MPDDATMLASCSMLRQSRLQQERLFETSNASPAAELHASSFQLQGPATTHPFFMVTPEFVEPQ